MKRSLHARMTLWFALGAIAVIAVFALVTYLHLRHELRVEQWERSHPEATDFILHGRYSEAEVNDIAGELLRLSLIYAVAAGAIAVAIGFYLSRKSLQPISQLNQQLQAIDATTLSRRLNTPEADHEIKDITANINQVLERLEKAYRDLSNFSSFVAHELKTPLTHMRLQLEESAASIEPELSEALQEGLYGMEKYVEQCLLIARAEVGQLEIELRRVNLSDLVEDQLEPFARIAQEQGRTLLFQPESPSIEAQASPTIARQILHNLIQNSLQHGVGNIELILRQSDDEALLQISNRPNPKTTASTGMGLRIVRALAQCHPGLTFTQTTQAQLHQSTLAWTLPRAKAKA